MCFLHGKNAMKPLLKKKTQRNLDGRINFFLFFIFTKKSEKTALKKCNETWDKYQ